MVGVFAIFPMQMVRIFFHLSFNSAVFKLWPLIYDITLMNCSQHFLKYESELKISLRLKDVSETLKMLYNCIYSYLLYVYEHTLS